MTRAEAVAYVKHLLFEDAATTGIATPAQINLTVDAANVTVWQRASILAPSLFSETSADKTYVAATGYYDLSGLSPIPSSLSVVQGKSSDRYYPIEEFKTSEKDRVETSGALYGQALPVGYWLDGEKLKFLPPPSANLTFRLTYVGRPVALSGDTDQLLLGKMQEWHLLVCYEAAMVLAIKDEAGESFKGIKFVRDEMKQSMERWISRRSTYRPHFIREVGF